jgi:D-beta-D-heptose 7-phosphate kinase/D-beta-D-heptose 1-phosphate adenosyltransferase
MEDLAVILEKLPSRSILVVGDLILDRYVQGRAARVSPEAPVLVFETESKRDLLGGACNVAANLVNLGARASVLGVIGEDVAGEQLLQLLSNQGIEGANIVRDPSRPTTRKTRYLSKTAQVLRVDEESRRPVSHEVAGAVTKVLEQRPFPYDAILMSDYGKGLLTRGVIEAAIAAARSVGGLVVADPKGLDYSIYRGVDLLTPNRQEAEAATGIAIRGLDVGGLEDLHRVAAELRGLTGVKTPTVTLGEDGMFFETEEGEVQIIPTEARGVFDVTGAGDTVAATLTLARACGVPLRQSVHLANVAAGLVVAHVGTWAVSRQELLSMLGRRDARKILTREEASSVAAHLRAKGQRLVFTNGCFDLVHPGHTDYLAQARSYGDALMVAVNSDASVQRQGKGPRRPVNGVEDRMAVLAALAAVDYVVPFDGDTPLDLIVEVTPKVLVKGEDWRGKGVVGREWVESHGGQVVLLKLRPGASTTSIIDRILGSQES